MGKRRSSFRHMAFVRVGKTSLDPVTEFCFTGLPIISFSDKLVHPEKGPLRNRLIAWPQGPFSQTTSPSALCFTSWQWTCICTAPFLVFRPFNALFTTSHHWRRLSVFIFLIGTQPPDPPPQVKSIGWTIVEKLEGRTVASEVRMWDLIREQRAGLSSNCIFNKKGPEISKGAGA